MSKMERPELRVKCACGKVAIHPLAGLVWMCSECMYEHEMGKPVPKMEKAKNWGVEQLKLIDIPKRRD